MTRRKIAIFDLDDTLIDTSHVYWTSRTVFIDLLVAEGLERELILTTFEGIDGKHIIQYGYVPERYERSMVATYSHLCVKRNIRPKTRVINEIRLAARIVQEQVPELIAGALQVLAGAKALGYVMVLVTRGINVVQNKKLSFHGLVKYFDYVNIVPKKSAVTFAEVIRELDAEPEDAWVIGDSIKSDINPAIETGANAILYLYTHHSYYWQQEYGVQPAGFFRLARNLSEVLSILENSSHAPLILQVPLRDPTLPI
ncbi:MAG: HAD family hydrolase [Polaromonas sp.]|nr:HAD family hydrolase [Polaromonas sp.]